MKKNDKIDIYFDDWKQDFFYCCWNITKNMIIIMDRKTVSGIKHIALKTQEIYVNITSHIKKSAFIYSIIFTKNIVNLYFQLLL